MIGPSGSGKTVVLNFLLAQSRKFAPRIIFFDKDRGAEPFLRAIGGRYDLLRPGNCSGSQPAAAGGRSGQPPVPDRLGGAAGRRRGRRPRLAQIRDAIDANFGQAARATTAAPSRRAVPGRAAVRMLRTCGRGCAPGGAMANAPGCSTMRRISTDLTADTVGFDMTQILDDPAVRTPAMMYLFHRVEQRLDGTPAIIVVDEGWKALDDDVFVRRIKDWEKTIRKRNGIVGFATQSAQDALESRIASAIIEQAATQVFMANPKARASRLYGGFRAHRARI